MSAVAEFTIPSEPFPFGIALAETSNVEIEVDRLVPRDESAPLSFWVQGCEPGVGYQ